MLKSCGRFAIRHSLKNVEWRSNSNASIVNIFDRRAKMLQRSRAAVHPDSYFCDYLKEEIGWRVADRVFDIKRSFEKVADIGCSRGYVTRHLTPDSVQNVVLCDTIQNHLDTAKLPDGINITKCIMDEENINLEPNSLDLVISSLCLHWVNDLPGCFDNIFKSLKQDGAFLATMFGEETLYELRSSLQLADLERNGGIAPHISPFTRIRDVGGLLNRSGFTLQTIDTDEIVVGYPSMFELMWDLQNMAENNAAYNRQLHLSRDTQMAAAAIYDELYGKIDEKTGNKCIPATYQIIYLLGWKPDKSQPVPLERGTGKISLKDLNKLNELGKNSGNIALNLESEERK